LENRYVNYFSRLANRYAGPAIAAVLLLCAASAASPVLAQTTAAPAQPAAQLPVIVGILGTQDILTNSTAGKQLMTQANASLKALSDASEKKEEGLRAQAQQLDTQRSANPPITQDDYIAKRKQLAAQDDQIREDFAKNKQALQLRVDKAQQVLLNATGKIVRDVMQGHGMTLVLNRAAAEFYPPQWDITNEVLQRLNKTLPSVKF
jgi:Skp family chaperone for outer membrane proteins